MIGLVALGCGGKSARSDEGDGSTGSPSTMAIDTAGLPGRLVLDCPGTPLVVALHLPCIVGVPRPSDAGTVNDVSCVDSAGIGAFRMAFPLERLASELDQPLTLPLVPGSVSDPSDLLISKWSGTVVFSRVDVEGRGFVARMSDAHVEFSFEAPPMRLSCEVPSTPFWGVARDF
jgi:hypothetical protein